MTTLDDEMNEPPKLTSALSLTEAAQQADAALPSFQPQLAPNEEVDLRIFGDHEGLHPVHQAGFVVWAELNAHDNLKSIVEWQRIYAEYLSRPVRG
jgi:hypothetical protein